MKLLTRYETIGIGMSIIAVVVVLGVVRFSPFSSNPDQHVTTDESDIIRVDPNADDIDAALRQAILDGSTGEGRITKLIVHDLSLGSGREARIGDTVTVHYIGLLRDGPEFENSYKKKQPISFKVGAGEVIHGLDRGIIGTKEGGTRVLIIPPTMAYGNTAVDPLPTNATLIFSIELLSIE